MFGVGWICRERELDAGAPVSRGHDKAPLSAGVFETEE
jgi:hypothetical protein